MAYKDDSVNGGGGRCPAPTARELTTKLGGVWNATKGEGKAKCPAHDDKNPSLDIKEGNGGKVLFKCRAGCAQGAVLDALRSRGMWPEKGVVRKLRSAKQTPISVHPYELQDGTLSFEVRVFKPGRDGREKDCIPYHKDANGKWKAGLPETNRYIPYRLPDLIEADPNVVAFVFEGETCVDAGRSKLNLLATTNQGGAGKWRAEHSLYLKDRDVVIVPDNDDRGRKHAEIVARSLNNIAARVRIVTLPGLKNEGDDVVEWLEAGGTAEQLWQLVDAAPDWTAAQSPAAGAPTLDGKDREQQGRFLLVRREGADELRPGVYHVEIKENEDGEKETVTEWVCSLLEPLAETRDRDNRSWGKQLEIVDGDDVRHIWVMPAKMGPSVGDGVEFRRELVDRGLKIAAGGKARNRLSDYVTTWRPSRKVRCINRVGWCGDAFVLPDKTYGGSEDVVLQVEGAPPRYAVAGSLEGWRDEIAAKCAGNSRLVFGVSAAFAGPILKQAGEESGGFNMRGPSSIGKTAALQVARSVWGVPLGTWRKTDNSTEVTAAGACDTLLPLDEMGQADPRVLSEVAYMLGNQRGKDRMRRDGGLRATHEWRLLFLSTGEVSLATRLAEGGIKARAGQEVRVLDIRADAGKGCGIFEDLHGFKGGADFAEYLKRAADRNCGHPGREFLARITNQVDDLPAFISEERAAFIAKHCPEGSDGQVRRACGRFAIVAIAGELATQAGITGWRVGEAVDAAVQLFKDWIADRGGKGSAEQQQAFAQVRLFLEQHGESRFKPAWDRAVTVVMPDSDEPGISMTDRPTINRAGFRRVTDGGTTFYVLPGVWRSEVCKGLDAKDVAAAMAERGWLLKGPDQFARSERIPGEKNLRVFVIPPAFLSGDDKT